MNDFMSYAVLTFTLCGFFIAIIALIFAIFVWPLIAYKFDDTRDD